MKIVAIIVARMTSNRLPGKPLLDLSGKTSLARHYERIKEVTGIHDIFLATSREASNRALIDEARRVGLKVYEGEPEDIVERFISIGKHTSADALVRIGCDKPLFCHRLLQQSVTSYTGEDYVHLERGLIFGISHEIISLNALEITHRYYRGTAIAQYIREHPHLFSIKSVRPESIYFRPEYRLSLDTLEDYRLLASIFDTMASEYDIIPTQEVIRFLDDNPNLAKMNRSFQEKNVNLYSIDLEKEPVFRIMMTDRGSYRVLDRVGEPVDFKTFSQIVHNRNRWAD